MKNSNRKEFHWKAKVFVYNPDGSFQTMITYHGIDSRSPDRLKRFEDFVAKKFPGLHHVNYYTGISSEFIRQQPFCK